MNRVEEARWLLFDILEENSQLDQIMISLDRIREIHDLLVDPDDEGYEIIESRAEFEDFCRAGGWDGIEGFHETTGVTFEEIRGVPFLVIHNRVFTK